MINYTKYIPQGIKTLLTTLFILILAAPTINLVKASPTKVSIDYYGTPIIQDPTLVPGTQFKVNITVDYVELLWAYQFELGEAEWWESDPAKYQGWNASILQLVAVENGPFLGSARGNVVWYPGEVNNTQGTLTLSGAALDPKRRFPTGGGTLATLTFKVVGYGTSPIHFGLDTALLNKTGGFELGPDWEPLRGTLNPDFLVDGYFDNRSPVIPSIPATVNVEPDALNLRSKGKWITCYIELPEGYNVNDINVSTVKLNDTIPAEPWPTEVGDYDNNGVPDLMVKFDRFSVINLLSAGVNTLKITGKVNDTLFEGTDTIKAIKSTSVQGTHLIATGENLRRGLGA